MSAFNNNDPLDKENYCSKSLLSHTSKTFKKMIFNQVSDHI